MTKNTVTKKHLQDALDEVGEKVTELLNPALSREELVVAIQDLDELVNGADDQKEDAEEDDE